MQIKLNSTNQFQFTRPKYSFGQKVRTESGQVGYIVGLDFYPETSVWAYGVYLVDRHNELVEELWYEAEQLLLLEEPNQPQKASYQINLVPDPKLQAAT
jgi:hypothetical protein